MGHSRFARLANKTFQNSIFLQFFVSTFVVCSENISTSIFNTNWPMLSIDNKKIFAIIMMIVQKPIIYTSRYFVTLSLNDFLRLLKLSYSLLSILRNY
ncbi:putative odorant receptor 92a [Aphidius gifuensis]|uniref:putative odorant receptor 92a n=1 Tax=Aphidius gifuensis TaxID=684658 RepID=UPI001CDCE2CD|nr:putative odorant receptor 92a [Aphidius gifuensis]